MSKLKTLSCIALLSVATQTFAKEAALTANSISAFSLPKNSMGIRLSYNRINDAIDIFDIKKKELGSLANFGSIGDATGVDLSLAYGASDFVSLYYNHDYLSLDYIDGKLKNNRNEFVAKVKIYENPMNYFENISMDIGFVRNSADDLDIKEKGQLNSLIQKVNPVPGFVLDGSVFKYHGQELIFTDAMHNEPIFPFIRIGNLSDDALYVRLLSGIHYETSLLTFFGGLKYTKIYTDVSIEPQEEPMQSVLKSQGYHSVNLDRNEKTAFFGLSYTVEFGNFILDANYEYLSIWGRSDDVKKTDDNHIINSALSYIINKNLLLFVGGKMMIHQFNGVIPYLYNKYTKNKYTKKYGYAKVGLVYNFDTSKLFSSNSNYSNY